MASTRYATLPLILSVGKDEIEIAAEVEFTFRGGTSDSWMEPGDPAEIEVGKVELVVMDKTAAPPVEVRQDAPAWLVDWLANSEDAYQKLGDAVEWGAPDEDDYL
jgi:hypothetical protein